MAFMKVRPMYKSVDYCPPPTAVSDSTVIALPAQYGPEPPPKTDSAQKNNQAESTTYFKEDDSIIEEYF